ncbi:MAG TPA: NADH-quinone oxidoreductase subunit J [Anaerolineales bacterium]|nr:NADH-quinone oxidoreductase subunit J [Anaerolineales bacterium]
MTPVQVLFIISSLALLGLGFMVVTTRNLVRAALYLIGTLFSVAVVFVLLEASFLAVVQVVVYIGAIAILFIFAVMLTRRVMQDTGSQTNSNWPWAALVALLLFGGLTYILTSWSGSSAEAPALSSQSDMVTELGKALVNPDAYILPFEVASILLLAALIGAVVVAWDRD